MGADVAAACDAWQRRIDNLPVERLAQAIADTGSSYHFLTLGQNSGFYCSPNAVYDQYVGEVPSRLSRRDLMADLAQALARRGVRTLAYLPSHAPVHHRLAVERLGFTPSWDASMWGLQPGMYLNSQDTPPDPALRQAQQRWEAIICEWSKRWGSLVSGWWIDGCYYADQMYLQPEAPNFRSFASALKAGNPHAIVAFNPGVRMPIISATPFEDYTAGEVNHLVVDYQHQPLTRHVEGAQLHILSFLGRFWGSGEPRFSDELVVGYTRHINQHGGVVTWDVPISAAGDIPVPFLRQLRCIGKKG